MKSIIKIFLVTLLSLIFCDKGVAQERCIEVRSLETNQAIKSVIISNDCNSKTWSTNENGIACFENDTCLYVTLKSTGYFEKKIQLPKTGKHNIYLYPTTSNLSEFVILDSIEFYEMNRIQMGKDEKMFLYHGKKSERIQLKKEEINLPTNNTRQIYGKISGLNSIQTSESGIGTEIGVRGLSAERSSNLNIRQNGYDISADALGYPDAYYIPPAQSIETIESVRGAGALQYGTQFGGMINYSLKSCKFEKDSIALESQQTIGSNSFFNSYNAVMGKKGKFSFYTNFLYKKGDGWKSNSQFNSKNFYFNGTYSINNKLSLTAEFSHYYYLAKQPGGLTDAMFENDPSQSIRDRNWFSVSWNLPSITLNYIESRELEFSSKFFGLAANRKALGFLGNITRIDPLGGRELLIDNYLNIGNETKLIKRYTLNKNTNILVAGFRVFKGNTRKRQGEANDGIGPDFEYTNPNLLEGSDYLFPSLNSSFFLENVFYLTKKLSVIAGARGEYISTNAEGYYRVINTDLAGNILTDETINEQKNRNRQFVLFSIGASYETNSSLQLFANFSQNYRAINFNDLRITNANFRVDPNLQDETGYNADIGIRGMWEDIVGYDISLFYLKYNNRIGFSLKTDEKLFNTYRFRSNISESRNLGVESLIQVNILKLLKVKKKKTALIGFINTSFVDGRYINSKEPAFENKKVEFIPNYIVRSGLTFRKNTFSFSYQFNYTSAQFTDATNSEFSSNAISGIIPHYWVSDISLSYKHNILKGQLSVQNLLNQSYFNKRAVGYPGPGIIPAPPRTIYFTLSVSL
ncbi:MAG: TonB-dependent receptor family protein [Flavobacteriales bacterium]